MTTNGTVDIEASQTLIKDSFKVSVKKKLIESIVSSQIENEVTDKIEMESSGNNLAEHNSRDGQ